MTFDRAFAVGLAWRVVLLVLLLAALVYLATSGYRAPTIVAWMAVVGLIGSLWVYVQRTNMEVARFVEALNYADFSQSFGHKREGLGFDELGASMNAAVAKLREERARAQDSNRTLAALVDEVPTPLLGLHVDGRIDLLNKAARRMFSAKPVTHVQDLGGYGSALAEAVERTPIAERRIVELEVDEAPQRATLSVAEVRPAGGEPLRVLAIQPIQNELDQVEMSAWRDLVRVLTHEIMNSVTPITSLSKTAAELIAEADDGRSEVLADARAAVETVARRADGVMHFVQTYRQITRSPPLRRQTIRLAALFDELRRLFRADWPVETAGLEVGVEPAGLELFADPDLIAQLLINLLRNGAEAAVGHAERPRLSLTAHRNRQGRAVIEVSDNGPGVPPDKVDEIFLPFFTTKATGTGVGLSLARQVALAHGGSLTYLPNDAGGATFRIVI
jgi:nitrogen fixation/metabolism regulation signal transduction histidine kinase